MHKVSSSHVSHCLLYFLLPFSFFPLFLVLQQQQQLQQQYLPKPFTIPAALPPPAPVGLDCRIYVGSLNYDLKEADIKALFASFGAIKSFTMSYDNVTGKSKGYCFVEYETAEMAESALVRLLAAVSMLRGPYCT